MHAPGFHIHTYAPHPTHRDVTHASGSRTRARIRIPLHRAQALKEAHEQMSQLQEEEGRAAADLVAEMEERLHASLEEGCAIAGSSTSPTW